MSRVLTILVAMLCTIITDAQSVRDFNYSDTVALDPEVRKGVLPNGFTYYIRHNESAKGMVNFYFVVNAGYNQEDKDQIQLAHLLEHMPFKGTKHFPDPYDFFEKNGLEKGMQVNASTNNESTYYYLKNIPTNNSLLMKKGLEFMHDLGHDILLDSLNIEKERGAVWNELKRGSGVEYYMESQYNKSQGMGNPGNNLRKFEDNLTNIKSFNHSSLFRFYNDWYWSDNQAIIIVGDINVDSMEKQVGLLFSDLKPSVNLKRKNTYSLFQGESQVVTVSHPDCKEVSLRIILNYPFRTRRTYEDYAFLLKSELVAIMIRNRFGKLNEDGLSPFSSATGEFKNRSGTLFGVLTMEFKIKQDMIEGGIKRGFTEVERLIRYGFSVNEWRNAASDYAKNNLSKEGIKSNDDIAGKYISHYTSQEAYPGPDSETVLMKQLFSDVTYDQINLFTKELIADKVRDIVFYIPEKLKSLFPDETTVRNWLGEVKVSQIGLHDEKLPQPVKEIEIMTPQEIAKLSYKNSYIQEYLSAVDATQIKLANGARVILRPLKEKKSSEEGKISILGISPGGKSVYQKFDRALASEASAVALKCGAGTLNQEEINALRKDKELSVSATIFENLESIVGVSSVKSEEQLFQLIYQYFRNPKFCPDAYKGAGSVSNSNNQPDFVINQLADSLLRQMGVIGSLEKFTPMDQSKVDLNRAYAIYKERFSNAGDFTFIVTGDFDMQKTTPLVIKYIGSLPGTGKKESSYIRPAEIKQMNIRETVYTEESLSPATVKLHFGGAYEINFQNDLVLDVLSRVLEMKLTARLRGKEGGTYAVSVGVGKYENSSCLYRVNFQCDPAIANKMAGYVIEEFDKLKQEELNQDLLTIVKSRMKTKLKEDLESAYFWRQYLIQQVKRKQPITDISKAQNIIENITTKDIQQAAQRYLSKDRHFEIIALPENMKPKEN